MRNSAWLLLGLLIGGVAEHNLNKIPSYAKLFSHPHVPVFIAFPEDQKGTLLRLLQGEMIRYSTNPADNHVQGEQAFKSAETELIRQDICLSEPNDSDGSFYMRKCSDALTLYRVTIPISADGHIMEPIYY
ncbi:hypothetical protein [Asaia prunellae]|uniref:hypothetical protein n=1 Tax=Asaia prunellae TaxID=610245 RepID=UPI0011DE090C|nr:hypothetical protein [Asaia prunellae]